MRYSLVILDLDGTLADSFPWFQRNLNDVADRFGFRRVAEGDVDMLRHAGTRDILNHLDVPLWKVPMIASHMRRLKTAHIAEIPLFDGVHTMLRTLAGAGLRLALVSSDSNGNVRRQLGKSVALFSDFECGAAIFGKAAKFRRILARAAVDATRVIAIGDETRDIEAARETGIACGAVTWGYAAPNALRAREPDFVFERMDDIPRALLAGDR
jgi:phosphoglycolate phosphatase